MIDLLDYLCLRILRADFGRRGRIWNEEALHLVERLDILAVVLAYDLRNLVRRAGLLINRWRPFHELLLNILVELFIEFLVELVGRVEQFAVVNVI